MNLYAQSIETRIDWLFAHAKKHGEAFAGPETWLARKRYLAEHPTAISVLKCMDGRINIPVATETPMAVVSRGRGAPDRTGAPPRWRCSGAGRKSTSTGRFLDGVV